MLTLKNFKGEIPKVHETLLPEGYASYAEGTRLDNGTLSPTRKGAAQHTFGSAVQTIYRHNGAWIGWDAVVNAVPGPVAADRLYITGDGAPRVRVNGVEYPLKLEAPTTAATTANTGTPDTDTSYKVQYTYTFVTSLDEESAPAPLSTARWWSEDVIVTLSDFETPPVGRLIDRYRIYRTETSSLGTTDLYFCAEIAATLTTWDHDIEDDPVNEVIASMDYDPAPDDLRGIIAAPNGFMAGFDGKELWFSEPYRPHAWPTKYMLTTDFEIVALASFGNSIAVVTTGTPYVAQGSHPENMVLTKIEASRPCVSAQGVVDLGYAAIYPSTEGLVAISESGADLITRNVFTREQWDDINPDTIVAEKFAGRYAFSFDLGAERATYLIDIEGDTAFLVRDGLEAIAFFNDPGTGAIYYTADGLEVRSFDDLSQNLGEYLWRSGVLKLPSPVTFGAAKVLYENRAEDPQAFAMRVYGDGNLIHTITELDGISRLPGDKMYSEWQVQIEGNQDILSVLIAGSPDEIAGAIG